MDIPVCSSTLKIMYKSVSMFLALAVASPVWAQSPESAPAAEKAVQVKLVRVAENAVPEVAVIQDSLGSPVSVALRAEDMEAQEKRGYLGIYLGGDDNHVSVQSVAEGTGAAKAGLKAGDVILRLNKDEVKNAEQLIKALAAFKPGESVAIQAKRGKDQILFMVKLGQRPQPSAGMALDVTTAIPEKARNVVRLEALGYGGDAEVKGHHGGDGHGEGHGHGAKQDKDGWVELIDARELGVDKLDGHALTEDQMKELIAQLEKLESGRVPEGHGGVTWFVDSEVDDHGAWTFAPEAGIECDVEVECTEGEGPGVFTWKVEGGEGPHGRIHSYGGAENLGGIIELKLECESGKPVCGDAPKCDSKQESCGTGGVVTFGLSASACGEAKPDCGDSNQCETKRDCSDSNQCDTQRDCGETIQRDCGESSKCDTKSDCGESSKCEIPAQCDDKGRFQLFGVKAGGDCGPSDCAPSDCGPSDCAPKDCGTQDKSDCHEPSMGRFFRGGYARGQQARRSDPRMGQHLRQMMGGRRGALMERIHGGMMGGHGIEEIHRMHGVEKMHGGHGMDEMHGAHGDMLEAMQEMTREMRAMRKEMKQLRSQVAKMHKGKAAASKKAKRSKKSHAKSSKKGKRHSKSDHKAKAIAAKKAKFLKMKKAKGEHHSHGSFLFDDDAKVVSKKVIVVQDKDGKRTFEVIED